tara:strand:- start:186318 stop:188582 length:2265 start_codon:yes stop_codon:yes gene_type:complete
MNIKATAKTQSQERVKAPEVSNGGKKVMRAANGSLPVSMGKDKTAYIVKLLDTVSQQLRRSETERELLWRELEETRRLLGDLDERTGRSEKSYSFIREEVERTQQNSSIFIEQLNAIESVTSNAVERLDGVSEENASMVRKLERISQDKIRLNRKINIIEEAVTSTREALEAKALVLLTDRSVAQRTSLPQIDSASLFEDHNDVTPAKTPEALVDEEAAMIKRRLFNGVSVSVLLVVGVAGLWAFSHFGPSIQITMPKQPLYTADADYAASSAEASAAMSARAAAIASASPSDFAKFEAEVDKTLASNAYDMDSVAAMMNSIEPQAQDQSQSQSQSQIQTESSDKVMAQPEIPASVPVDMAVIVDVEPEVVVSSAVSTPIAVSDTATLSVQPVQPEISIKPSAPVMAEQATVVSAVELSAQLKQLEQSAANKIAASKASEPLSARMDPDTRLTGFAKEIETASFSGNPEAQHDLAALYTAGQDGVPQDFERAVFWFGESGHENVANARYNLGVLYQQGLGTLKNMERAIALYQSAALLGHPEAQYNLGIAYAEGIGVPYSIESAVHYFEESAIAGVPESAFNLGLIYENALLGRRDNNKALFWYNLASDQDNIDAQNALSQLTTKLGLSLEEVRNVVRVERERVMPQKNQSAASANNAAPQSVARVKSRSPQENEIIDVRSVMPDMASFELIAPIQEQLMALGLYPGPADGVSGPMTEDAIRSYQSMFNIPVNGMPSAALVEHMLNNTATASGQ